MLFTHKNTTSPHFATERQHRLAVAVGSSASHTVASAHLSHYIYIYIYIYIYYLLSRAWHRTQYMIRPNNDPGGCTGRQSCGHCVGYGSRFKKCTVQCCVCQQKNVFCRPKQKLHVVDADVCAVCVFTLLCLVIALFLFFTTKSLRNCCQRVQTNDVQKRETKTRVQGGVRAQPRSSPSWWRWRELGSEV